MLDRRGFLSSLAGAAGVAGTLSLSPAWPKLLEQAPAQLPDKALFDSNEEAYWTEIRKQFLIPADEVYLNNGTVGSSPAPVLRAIFEGYNTTEKDGPERPGRLSDLGLRHLERVSRSAGGIRGMHAR